MNDKRPSLNAQVRKQMSSKALMEPQDKSRGKMPSKNDTLLKNYPLKKILLASDDLQDSPLKRDLKDGENFHHNHLKSADHFHTFKPQKKSRSKKVPKKSAQTKLLKVEKNPPKQANARSRQPLARKNDLFFKKEKSTGCLKRGERPLKVQMLTKKKKSKSCKKIAPQKELSCSQTKLQTK